MALSAERSKVQGCTSSCVCEPEQDLHFPALLRVSLTLKGTTKKINKERTETFLLHSIFKYCILNTRPWQMFSDKRQGEKVIKCLMKVGVCPVAVNGKHELPASRDENTHQTYCCCFGTDWSETCSADLSAVDRCCTAVCLSAPRPLSPCWLLPTGSRTQEREFLKFPEKKKVKPTSAGFINDFSGFISLFPLKKNKNKKQNFFFPQGIPGLYTQLPG